MYVDQDGEVVGTVVTFIVDFLKTALFKGGLDFSSKSARNEAWKNFDPSASWSKTNRAWQIDKGLFSGNTGQILLKWTWGLPNTIIGNAAAHSVNVWGGVDKVTHLDGAVALSGTNNKGALTIGQYIFGPDNFEANWQDHLFVHEYGHYIQSNWFGPFYLPVVGSTSLASAAGLGKPAHQDRWFEVQASRMAANYFDLKYGSGSDGYLAGSVDYFDKNSFVSGGYSPYLNTRTLTFYQGRSGHPINGAIFSGWDIVVPIVSLGLLYWIFF